MPRNRRFCPAGIPVHVIQRGNNRQRCFTSDNDMAAYVNWLHQGAVKLQVHIHGWVLMTNHIHLLLTPAHDSGISKLLQYIGRQYVRYFNQHYARSGTLFEGRFRSSVVQDQAYLLDCLRYIELNPVRAGIATDPGDYRWSSYAAHGLGKQVRMWTPHSLYTSLGADAQTRQAEYRAMVGAGVDVDLIAKIRHCANKGLVLGTEAFRKQFELLTGDHARLSKRYSGTLL